MTEPLFGYEWNQVDAPPNLERGLFTVVARDTQNVYHAVGTGFVIKFLGEAALAVSAAHVFDEIRRLQHRRDRRAHMSALPEFVPGPTPINLSPPGVVTLTNFDSRAIFGNIKGVAFDEARDIGVAQIEAQAGEESGFSLHEFLLDDQLPTIGQLVCIASYVGLACRSGEDGAHQLERQAVVRVGKVLGVFPTGHRLCRGPCFETSIPIFSGMSGGPVFLFDTSNAIRVIGVVCSDPDLDGPDKNDKSKPGCSLVAIIPVTRLSGSPSGLQRVEIKFVPTAVAGACSSFDEMSLGPTA